MPTKAPMEREREKANVCVLQGEIGKAKNYFSENKGRDMTRQRYEATKGVIGNAGKASGLLHIVRILGNRSSEVENKQRNHATNSEKHGKEVEDE